MWADQLHTSITVTSGSKTQTQNCAESGGRMDSICPIKPSYRQHFLFMFTRTLDMEHFINCQKHTTDVRQKKSFWFSCWAFMNIWMASRTFFLNLFLVDTSTKTKAWETIYPCVRPVTGECTEAFCEACQSTFSVSRRDEYNVNRLTKKRVARKETSHSVTTSIITTVVAMLVCSVWLYTAGVLTWDNNMNVSCLISYLCERTWESWEFFF